MQLRTKIDLLEKWNHGSHYITLVLVATASLSGLASRYFPDAEGAEPWIDHALHIVHLSALLLALIHVSLLLVFSRNVGKGIAAALDKQRLPAVPFVDSGSMQDKSYRYRALPVSTEDIAFVESATGDLAETLFTMNRELFEGGPFEMSREEIKARNTTIINKNPTVFMLVRNPLREGDDPHTGRDLIGYSCVFPLNEIGADCYLNGVIRDRDMRPSLICAKGQPSGAILVFAIGLLKKYRNNRGLRVQYYPFLLRCAEHHIGIIEAAHPNPAGTTVWAVSEYPKLEQHFRNRGFTCQDGKESADGYCLYSRRQEPASPAPAK